MSLRVGTGFDIHRLVENRKLIVGGIEIDSPRGLQGHSDADVLLHAVCDALLGAAGLGDLGLHFPSKEPQFKDISSREILRRVHALILSQGYRIVNIDTTIIAEAPQLSGYLEAMRLRIAETLSLSPGQVNVKAKTHEGVDAVGHGDAIAAHAVALIEKE
ncbi:MAG: 2-C-methyl-D-erythritol 2,4-cyclodiphosphate synthase [Acidobacteriia bacterium]|nr:2-C-methyl-D-erythritol 2,4-cyclodiphosphate synthase [Terriglobia bacterium]